LSFSGTSTLVRSIVAHVNRLLPNVKTTTTTSNNKTTRVPETFRPCIINTKNGLKQHSLVLSHCDLNVAELYNRWIMVTLFNGKRKKKKIHKNNTKRKRFDLI
jgi:hypothetical protein